MPASSATTPTAVAAMGVPANIRSLILALYDAGAFQMKETLLKCGVQSPFYVDLRVTVSHPTLLSQIACALQEKSAAVPRTHLCGVPYTALPFATAMSLDTGVPMLMRRKERKAHGTKKEIEGDFVAGNECLVVEDLGAREKLAKNGIELHAVTTIKDMVAVLRDSDRLTSTEASKVLEFVSQRAPSPCAQPYEERARGARAQLAQRLFSVMADKKSNLSVAADVTTRAELLALAHKVGPHIAVLKTHADIVSDWDASTGTELRKLATRHNFLLFEDRKFADIGFTVVNQLSGGVHAIADWADFVNAHAVPGPGVIAGVHKVNSGRERAIGLSLLAEMSSKGNLATKLPEYTAHVIAMAQEHPELALASSRWAGLVGVKMPTSLCL
eukprot:IDg1119t1